MKRKKPVESLRKRRKSDFSQIAALESEQCRMETRKSGRKSSLSALRQLEHQNNDIHIELDETVIPCAQTDDDGAKKKKSEFVSIDDAGSDEDLFKNDSLNELKGNLSTVKSRSPSPMPSFISPSHHEKGRRFSNSCSVDWGGDDSLLLKCSEELFNSDGRLILQSDKGKEERTSVERTTQINHDKSIKNDSVLGDVDLSLLEKQILPDCGKNNFDDNANIVQNINSEMPTMTLTTPNYKCNTNNTSPKLALAVNELSFNPMGPMAASTPNKSEPTSGKLIHRLRERFKANAKQQTNTSYLSRDAAKILPDLKEIPAVSQDQLTSQDKGPFYGLPKKVEELMARYRGIKKLYEWQHKCLTLKSVLKGENLIYSLPTSGGKTLVAEILIMKELLCKERDAILVLPFVAIVQEKVRNIAQFADELDFLIEEYAGSKGKFPPTNRRKRKSIFICTIEKANTLVNSLIEVGRLESIGMVVVDELHMLGEGGRRGATIEMMLAKIMHVSSSTQIIGMSATLSNITDLAKFLRAEVYTNDFRPVALDEYVKASDTIFKVHATKLDPSERLEFHRVIGYSNKEMSNRDTDHLATMVLEVIPDHSCLIFCATKKNCENVATMICKLLPKSLQERKMREKKAILETLYQDSGGAGICPVLLKTIPFGVAYHHSGLTSDERILIEESYTDGVLCVIACTSTLAAGVNLPARRVIIRSPYVARNFLSRSQYKQMIGRAGRAGIDTKGESFLIMTKIQDKHRVLDLVSGPVETCLSSLMYDGGKGFKTLVLNLIGLKIMKKLSDVKEFFAHTLISVQLESMPEKFSHLTSNKESKEKIETDSLVEEVTKNALQELLDLKLIKLGKLKEDEKTPESSNISDLSLEATLLGTATNRGPIDLSISNTLYNNLKIGLENLVTPHDAVPNIKPNWMIYFEEYGKLTPDEQNSAAVIGVPENYIALKAAGHRTRTKKVKDEIVTRFYVTLMLYLLFRGRSVWDVAARFEQPRGVLQSLLASSAAFSSCILHFTKELEEFWPYHSLLEKLIQSLQYCTTAELLPLMEIPGVKIARAKQLFNAGHKTLAHIAKADANKLVNSVENLHRKQALQIIASAKVLLKEKVEELQAEAEDLQTITNL